MRRDYELYDDEQEYGESNAGYTSRYRDDIEDLTSQILNRKAFRYDHEKDPVYQQYEKTYTREGQRAMQDTLGQVSARTGGYASSYAGSAAQQTYDNYMGQLADKIPELRQLAYDMYVDEGNAQREKLDMLMAMEQNDYARYQDRLDRQDRLRDAGSSNGRASLGGGGDLYSNLYDNEQEEDDATITNRHGDSWVEIPGHGRYSYDELYELVQAGKIEEVYSRSNNRYTYRWKG